MRYKIYTLVTILAIVINAKAQEKWDLRKCVEYAMANNISVKQTGLQSKIAELQLRQSKLGQLPSLSFAGSSGFNNGRNQDPITFSLINQSYLSSNIQLQTSADIFNWFSKRNTILANQWEAEAAKANTDKLKNDIALTIANAYLQILLTKEQENIAAVQLKQSQAQLINTRKLVNAGSLPELNAAELEAQVARDSATYISARGNTQQSILNLKAGMSLDAAAAFDIEVPPVEKIPVENIADLQPESVYTSAIANLPQQRVNDYKLRAAEKNALAAKGAMKPSISVFGGIGSRYANPFNVPNYNRVFTGVYTANGLKSLNAAGLPVNDIGSPEISLIKNGTIKSDPFFLQLDQNFNQSIGLSLNIPIFNGSSLRTAYQRSKINIQNLQYQKQADNLKLKQDIYQAYNSATVALEKFNAGQKSVAAAERSFSFAQKRYDVGMLTLLELLTNQNNLTRAKLENVLNQFDYVFKMKVLEFYKGQGLKL